MSASELAGDGGDMGHGVGTEIMYARTFIMSLGFRICSVSFAERNRTAETVGYK